MYFREISSCLLILEQKVVGFIFFLILNTGVNQLEVVWQIYALAAALHIFSG